MVFGVVSSDCEIMSPFILQHALPLNSEAYIKFLEVLELFWMERMAAERT